MDSERRALRRLRRKAQRLRPQKAGELARLRELEALAVKRWHEWCRISEPGESLVIAVGLGWPLDLVRTRANPESLLRDWRTPAGTMLVIACWHPPPREGLLSGGLVVAAVGTLTGSVVAVRGPLGGEPRPWRSPRNPHPSALLGALCNADHWGEFYPLTREDVAFLRGEGT